MWQIKLEFEVHFIFLTGLRFLQYATGQSLTFYLSKHIFIIMSNNISVYCNVVAFKIRERMILQSVWMPVKPRFFALERILQPASVVAQHWTSSNFSPLCLAHISHDGVTARSVRAVLMGPLSPLLWPQQKLGCTVTVTIYHNSHNFSCSFPQQLSPLLW